MHLTVEIEDNLIGTNPISKGDSEVSDVIVCIDWIVDQLTCRVFMEDVVMSAGGGGSRHVCFCSEVSRASFTPNLLTSLSALFWYPVLRIFLGFSWFLFHLILLKIEDQKKMKEKEINKEKKREKVAFFHPICVELRQLSTMGWRSRVEGNRTTWLNVVV